MIKVLWIDDECLDQNKLTSLGVEFVEYASKKGIEVTPMSNYEEGLRAIEEHPSEWSAVILDIREQKAMDGDGADGYNEARHWLDIFHYRHNQAEPYVFTLSGEKQYHESNSTIRKEPYCTKPVYDKNGGDYIILFEDIRKIENVSILYRLQENYKEVLTAARGALGESAYNRLFVIMKPMLLDGNNTDSRLLNEIRKYLEDFIIPELQGCGFFPEGVDTLNKCSIYVGSRKDVPEYIKRSFHSLVSITQMGSHGKTNESLTIDEDVRYGKAPYLLRSCVFEMFNIVYWMKEVVCNKK